MEKTWYSDIKKDNIDWGTKSIGEVIDFIELKHHKYMNEELPKIKSISRTIRKVHGDSHPELLEVDKVFNELNDQIYQYIEIEGKAFSLIKDEEKSEDIINELKEIQEELKNGFKDLRNRTSDYVAPEDGCQTYDLTYAKYKELEGILFHQLDLENNSLFPKLI